MFLLFKSIKFWLNYHYFYLFLSCVTQKLFQWFYLLKYLHLKTNVKFLRKAKNLHLKKVIIFNFGKKKIFKLILEKNVFSVLVYCVSFTFYLFERNYRLSFCFLFLGDFIFILFLLITSSIFFTEDVYPRGSKEKHFIANHIHFLFVTPRQKNRFRNHKWS